MTAPRKEIIGNAELWLGDCFEILPMLPRPDAIACRRIEDAQRQQRMVP